MEKGVDEKALQGDVVAIVEQLLCDAIAHHASDIHLEATPKGLRIRFRFDGMLHDRGYIGVDTMPQVVSRLKVLAGINIAEKRIPQDGTYSFEYSGNPIDVRIATFPAVHGEKVVIRILDREQTQLVLDRLGMSPQVEALVCRHLVQPQGFFLVTGPTGSGKTTTLYSALAAINDPDKNIVTLEDPIEYHLEGITQSHIRPDIGFSFAQGIRSVLRQDPDVLLVGEIRDKETAQAAVEAALTGHLVLSTLHTHDAPSSLVRLMDMGIKPFLLNAVITGILAQRLARTICPLCRRATAPTDQEQAILRHYGCELAQVWHGAGCDACLGLGCAGRIGLFELLLPSEALRSALTANPERDALYKQAVADGMKTLVSDGIEKVKTGRITVQELVRVLGAF